MIKLNQLSMAYGQRWLFIDVNLNLNEDKCYVLLGANGCGKSTLFRLMTGEEEASSGDVIVPKDATIGWLKQDQFDHEDTPIKNVVLQGKQTLWQALNEKERLLENDDWDEKQIEKLCHLEEVIANNDGYAADSQIESILSGLGIEADKFAKPLRLLSGGYKLRVLLARTLFQNPSILLLDEPTNHLDILSIRWLEKFLKTEFKGLVVCISHDIGFIDNLADYTLDLDYGEVRQYSGNYNKFLAEKDLIETQKLVEKKSLEDRVAHLQQFVDKFKAKASKAAQARSRMKMIDKIEIPDVKKSSRISPKFNFMPKKPTGKIVLTVDKLSKKFKEKTLFNDISFEVARGERLAIMGANGVGKSTLIKILTDSLASDSGIFNWGHNVDLSYFSQDHHDLLNTSINVLDWLADAVSGVTEQQVRQALGQMYFTKDDVDKNILSLSGGESARLLLAKVMLESPNTLILDEPTNHMDLETIMSLSSSLKKYTGTLIFVSHDRDFIDRVATRIIYISPGQKMIDYKGNYTGFSAQYLQ